MIFRFNYKSIWQMFQSLYARMLSGHKAPKIWVTRAPLGVTR